MPYEIQTYNDYICATYHQLGCLSDRYKLTTELIHLCKEKKLRKLLIDVRKYDSHFEPIDFFAFIYALRKDLLDHSFKMALVTSEINTKYMPTKDYLSNMGLESESFTDKGSALDWLLGSTAG